MTNRLLNPFEELQAIHQALGEPLDSRNPFSVHFTEFPVDLYETRDEFVVQAYLPGVAHEDVAVELDGNQLTIKANREAPNGNGITCLHMEAPHGTFYRTLSLGRGIQGEKIAAAWRDGMLMIRIPKLEQARAKVIPIQVESGPSGSPPSIASE